MTLFMGANPIKVGRHVQRRLARKRIQERWELEYLRRNSFRTSFFSQTSFVRFQHSSVFCLLVTTSVCVKLLVKFNIRIKEGIYLHIIILE